MTRKLLTAAALVAGVLLLCTGWAVADEKDAKDAKPGTGGPPPGKGWRKNEAPAAPAPAPNQGKYAVPTAPPAKGPTAKAPVPTPPKDEGIGATVSAWARSGIHGRELAARIHQLQAVRAKTNPPPTAKPEKKGKPEVVPPTQPPTPKKKGKPGGEDD